ncbi:hypothetical protein DL769_004906 [Monosporascus sp. CRB-8-3]|nr:hypothetical protein DL769_004906 [Monosporascus sp. CRB-8-3]
MNQQPVTSEQGSFVPFTKAERIQQLGEIDKDIVSLLRSAGQAVNALGKKEPQGGDTAMDYGNNQANVFEDSMNDFMRTLRRVNVGIKRQILGLEEAGIITLRKDDGTAADSQGSASQQSRLEPDGDGKIGGLDPGWLNSRSNQVEREMEAELWGQADEFLRKLLEEKGKAKVEPVLSTNLNTFEMDLGEAGDSPWGDVPSSSTKPATTAANEQDGSLKPEDAQSSQQSQPSKLPRGSRAPVRRLVAQPTRLQAVDDDPLGPLGPLGGDANAGPDAPADEPPVPPQKERVVVRTTMPQQAQRKAGPADPHRVDEDNFDRAAGPRAPPPVEAALPSPIRTSTQPSMSIEQAAKPTFHITVGDPHKVGDLTSSHIVYSVRTRKTTSKAYRQPEFEVKRRYRDFLWLYNTMHGNNPGVVVPPPPEKQALNRFESNFVESRRAALEKMLNKIAAHLTLQHDPDLKLFLESESFNVDVKHKERREPLPTESKGMFGSLGLNMGGGSKFVEQDDWFHDRKVYLDALENQLKGLMKSMDTMVNQRKAMAEAAGDFSASLHALSTVELSPTLSGPLEALSDLQLTIRDVYDRQAQQDVLTFGITIDEYIRLIGSVKLAFGQRQKAFHAWHSAESELQKRKSSQDKLLRQGKSQQDRLNQVGAEVADAERKVHQARLLFEDMGRLLRSELDRFEREKVEDFKSSVETFLESAVEAQKELIEKWETFLMQLDAEDDETVFYKPPVYETADKNKGRGDTAVDRARATIHEDSD